MMDAENSDDERYANESFENESDAEVREMSEFESELTENSEDNDDDDDEDDDDDDEDEDDEDLPSVKINAGPIKTNNFSSSNKTDAVPFDSSSEEEDEVIIGQTLVQINTPSMFFNDKSTRSATHLTAAGGEETKESSDEEISEEEDEDEEEELLKIKDMEEKYLQQISAKAKETNTNNTQTEALEETGKQENTDESPEDGAESDSDEEPEAEEEDEYVFEEEQAFVCHEDKPPKEKKCDNESFKADGNNTSPTAESIDQSKLIQVIQSSLMKLKIDNSNENESKLSEFDQTSASLNEIKTQNVDALNTISPESIALAVVQALKSAGLKNLEGKEGKKPKALESSQESAEGSGDIKKPLNQANNDGNACETNESDIMPHKEEYQRDGNIEVEEIQNNKYDNDQYVYYDAHITSKTPTSFNSDDYVFHANFIKQFHRTESIDKLRAKPYPRKSMSFSNERMREIERHNQILLRKILSQKPTYTLKTKSSQSSLEKIPLPGNARLTTSAVNRKKKQRQIDLDNQVLKRKIEAIALRRRPFIT